MATLARPAARRAAACTPAATVRRRPPLASGGRARRPPPRQRLQAPPAALACQRPIHLQLPWHDLPRRPSDRTAPRWCSGDGRTRPGQHEKRWDAAGNGVEGRGSPRGRLPGPARQMAVGGAWTWWPWRDCRPLRRTGHPRQPPPWPRRHRHEQPARYPRPRPATAGHQPRGRGRRHKHRCPAGGQNRRLGAQPFRVAAGRHLQWDTSPPPSHPVTRRRRHRRGRGRCR